MAAAALEPWRAAAPRRRRPAARRPRPRAAAAARGPEAEPEVGGGVVLRRIREAEEELLISDFWSSALEMKLFSETLSSCFPKTFYQQGLKEPVFHATFSGWGLKDIFAETINKCLMKHLEQLTAPVGTLSEAIGNLHLDSSPDESDVAPGSIPGETLVPGPCGWKCVCYGIGNFATCVIARNQLTFLLLLLDKCQIPRSHCWVYDPLFSQLEIAVLNTLGVTVLSENEEGKRSVCGEPTIFYMVHCGTALYNNLLWSNWSVDALSKMLIIGNSFKGLEERLLTRILQKNYAYVAKISKGLEEQEFPQTSQYMDTFNDTSVHWFPVQKLKQLSTDTWAFREEPEYQDSEDLEIIRNKTGDPPATGSDLP